MTRPWLQRFSVACAVMGFTLGACGPTPAPLSPIETVEVIDPGMDPSGRKIPEVVLDAFGLPRDVSLVHPFSVKAGTVRTNARIYPAPSKAEVVLPPGATHLRLQLAGVAPSSPACDVVVDANWGGAGLRQRVPLADANASNPGPKAFVPLALRAPALATPEPQGSSVLTLTFVPEGCRGEGYVAVSMLEVKVRPTPASKAPNVVLLVTSALRKDRLDCGPTTHRLMPHVYRELCERGANFEHAYATAGWSAPSLASMLTGLRPSEHGVNRTDRISPRVTLVSESLQQRGYQTFAVLASQADLARGFGTFVDLQPAPPAERVIREQLAWLDHHRHRTDPFFSLLWFSDAQGRLDAVERFGVMPGACRDLQQMPTSLKGLELHGQRPTDAQRKKLACRRALYDVALQAIDHQLGKLFAGLTSRGLFNDTAFILVADHGEEFWEHQGGRAVGHGHSLHRELVHVPLLVVPPRSWNYYRSRPRDLVSVQDIFGTVLGFAGMQAGGSSTSRDLTRTLRGLANRPRKLVTSEGTAVGPEEMAVTTLELRAIHRSGKGLLAYDIRRDRGEHHPLTEPQPLTERAWALLHHAFGLQRPQEPTARPANGRPRPPRRLR